MIKDAKSLDMALKDYLKMMHREAKAYQEREQVKSESNKSNKSHSSSEKSKND